VAAISLPVRNCDLASDVRARAETYVPKRDLIPLASFHHCLFNGIQMKMITVMKIFAGLKKIRGFQRLELPYLKTISDFDIVIEIGYAEEQGHPLTLKQLFLLNICSRTTVRRKLASLIEQGVVNRRKHQSDNRASLLKIDPSSIKLLTRYGGAIAAVAALHFK
jgi:DNA-binding MarR family transcriptional regulator